ncbi:MAG: alpha/beta fold hydrolase, partial [Candidatus Binatia bacterium]
LEELFLDARVRVVSPDRPGYGGSGPQPNRTMSDWPADVAALADALGIERFLVAAHSTGGPYAPACGAQLPERVTGVITLGGVTDFGWPGAWDGYLEVEQELMRLPDENAVVARCEELFGSDGSGFMSASGFTFAPPDEALYADEAVASMLSVARAEAFRQGVVGYAQDIFVQGRPWPFDARAVSAPVHVLQGAQDTVLPLAHAQHTAQLVADATVRVVPGHGHFSILAELPAAASAMSR